MGKLPRDVFEDELYRIFSTIGPIYELRLMMDFSGSNRGFAFIQFAHRQDANRAIQLMDNYVCANRTLFNTIEIEHMLCTNDDLILSRN